MALVKCPEEACGRLVSTKAEVCPHCGCPLDAWGLVPPTGGAAPADSSGASAAGPDAERPRSLNGDVAITVRFRNRTGQAVRVYWLDYQGNRVLYKTLQPGEGYDQPTYLTHPWVFTDLQGAAFQSYLPRRGARVIDIERPAD
jgi:hypothetical protein